MTEIQIERRKKLLSKDTYRHIISRIEGDAEMLHRIRLAVVVKKQQPGQAYTPLLGGSK